MSAPPRTSSRRTGFTLLELLLVLLVVSTLALLVAPRLSGSTRLGRLRAQARTLVALGRRAKARAASEGRTYLLVVDGAEREARLARARDPLAAPDDEEDPEREAPAEGESWSRPLAFEDDVELVEVAVAEEERDPAEEVVLAFRPQGDCDAASLVLEADGDRLEVTLDGPLGLARVADPDAEEEDAPW